MKKLWMTLLALILALSLCAPALAEPEVTPDTDTIDDVEEWLFDEDMQWDVEDEEYDASIFDEVENDDTEMLDMEDTVEDTLLSAMEVYSWFVLYPLDVDYDKPNAAGDRYQVLDERFNTMDQLRGLVSEYFSDELVDELFSMGIYTEENGYLYATDEGRQIDEHIGETEFEVTEESPERIVYTVTVNYWGGDTPEEEVFTYVRQLIDGQWKFTIFPFFW